MQPATLTLVDGPAGPVAVHRAGHGPPLLLVHGIHAAAWQPRYGRWSSATAPRAP